MRFFAPLVLAATLMPLAALSPASAQENSTVYATSYIEVALPASADAATALKQLADAGRKEAGVIRFDVAQRLAPSNQFVVLQAWKDQAALDAHMAAASTKQAEDKLKALLIAPVDTRFTTPLTAEPAPQPFPAGAIIVVTHVDVAPPKRDEAAAALQALTEPSRKSAGSLRFEATREKTRLNHFTLLEVWKDQGAIDAYESAQLAKDFRNTVGAITGALHDRRTYKPL
jgi:quinol monooxygenase YgiN